MESIGRLAGGVAHDFNNMLGVILGQTELATEELPVGHPLRHQLQGIRAAAERSADLTRQLLAFARQQTVIPKVLDLNQTVEGMLGILGRLLGEGLELVWKPGAGLWQVRIDPSQFDQVLANLCVNSRDAMRGRGTVTLETRNVPAGTFTGGDVPPGDAVLLRVSDDGCGMDAETAARIFEPFFTTKGLVAGTGLGLATVYGVVRQHGGDIQVDSQPGRGTTFRILLPRHAGPPVPAPEQPSRGTTPRGKETILLVEDEPAVLKMTRTMLQHLGYTVQSALKPAEAARLARQHADEIDLLLTDLVMPEMNGVELAALVKGACPRAPRLFMSGYTYDVIAHSGVAEGDVHMMPKPFTLRELATAVRAALDEPRGEVGLEGP